MFWFLLICDLLVPVMMIFGGYMMWKHTPRKINGFVGYRTGSSMKNMETWNFANKYCGKLWCKLGVIMLVPSIIVHILLYNSSDNTMCLVCIFIMAIQLITMSLSIISTEKALKNKFSEENNDN